MDKNQQKQTLEIFEEFGKVLYKSAQDNLRDIERDKWKAFNFFPGAFFYRGRNDTTSEHYKEVALEKLRKHGVKGLLKNPKVIDEEEVIFSKTKQKQIRRSLNNNFDNRMFRAMLKKLSSVKANNYVAYTKQKIISGEFEEIYEEIREIYGAGPKTTALYLRDIVFALGLKDYLNEEHYFKLFPVDTWVRKICRKLRLVKESDNDDTIIKKIVSKCQELRVNSLLVNAGIWYIGKFSSEIVLRNLTRIKIRKYDEW